MSKYKLEQKVAVLDVVTYMIEENKTLEQAYEDKGVPARLQMPRHVVKDILRCLKVEIKEIEI